MILLRLWNNCTPKILKRNVTLILRIICLFGILTLVKFIFFNSNETFRIKRKSCPSHENFLRLDEFKELGVKIISSIPQRTISENNHVLSKRDGTNDAECVDVVIPVDDRVILCIHDPKKDLMVSAHIKKEGSWEKENVAAVYQAYKLFPDLVLVDLGCNVGAFTVPAAKLGMEVIAVDSMMASLKLLQRSLLINGMSCPVTLIHNALYSKRQQMRVVLDPTNIGGSQVIEILDFRKGKIPKDQFVDAVCLDDLTPFVRGRDVFLKMDLETTEVEVLLCANTFFTQVNVKVLLIEWLFYRHNELASGIIKSFLTSHGMIPTWGVDFQQPIDLQASHSWPDHVFWMKES